MTPQQCVGLAARLFSIWLAVSSLQAIAIGQALQIPGNRAPVWVPYLVAAVYLLVAAVLWLFPMFIAHRLVPRTHYDNTLQVQGREAAAVACVFVGLLLVALKALAPVATYLSLAAHWIGNAQPLSTMDADRHIDGLVGVLQLFVGVLLITKSRALAARMIPTTTPSTGAGAP